MLSITRDGVSTQNRPEPVPVLTEGKITKPASKLAPRILSEQDDHERIRIAVHRGAFIFPSDLFRHLTTWVKPKITSNGVAYDYYL